MAGSRALPQQAQQAGAGGGSSISNTPRAGRMRRRPQWPLAAALLLAASATVQGSAAPPSPPGVAAAGIAPPSLTFLSVGDAGKRTEDLDAVAHQMALAQAQSASSFVILGGDNFYENGVTGVDDLLWQTNFVDVFPESQFPVPFLAVRGNHDYRTAPEAQIDYYEEHGEAGRWYMPAPGYYSVQKELADGTTVDLLFLDTVTLAPQAAEEKVLLPANVTEVKAQQYAWLEEQLAASVARGADWRIVVGHYPVFSVGEHGDTPELMEELLPVLDKYGVDVYLSGHDHTMQHLQQRGSGVQFLINGSGSKLGSLGEATAASTVKAAQVYFGFMTHELTRDRLTTRALDSAGRTQYAFSQAPRSKQQGAKSEADAPAVHHAVPAKQQLVHKRGAASAAGTDAAFEDGAPSSSSSSSRSGSRLRRHVAAATPPLALAGGLLALVVLMAVVWRAGRRRGGASRPAGQQRYHSVVNSSSSASGASAAAAASVGRGVWSDDELDEYDPDLDSVGPVEEFQVELPHLA